MTMLLLGIIIGALVTLYVVHEKARKQVNAFAKAIFTKKKKTTEGGEKPCQKNDDSPGQPS